jgi:hypothetical protein
MSCTSSHKKVVQQVGENPKPHEHNHTAENENNREQKPEKGNQHLHEIKFTRTLVLFIVIHHFMPFYLNITEFFQSQN